VGAVTGVEHQPVAAAGGEVLAPRDQGDRQAGEVEAGTDDAADGAGTEDDVVHPRDDRRLSSHLWGDL
jgi:hypothetical protein